MITIKKNKLSEHMVKAGFTGAGLARAARISQGYVCQVMNGKRAILAPTAKKICDALGCNFDDVFEIGGRSDGEH